MIFEILIWGGITTSLKSVVNHWRRTNPVWEGWNTASAQGAVGLPTNRKMALLR